MLNYTVPAIKIIVVSWERSACYYRKINIIMLQRIWLQFLRYIFYSYIKKKMQKARKVLSNFITLNCCVFATQREPSKVAPTIHKLRYSEKASLWSLSWYGFSPAHKNGSKDKQDLQIVANTMKQIMKHFPLISNTKCSSGISFLRSISFVS